MTPTGASVRGLATPLLTGVLLTGIAGCATTPTQELAENLSAAILNQDDPELVRQGAPAHLLLVDGLIEWQPENPALMKAAAQLYGAYATVFVEDPARRQRMTEKARDYGRRALCVRRPAVCTEPAPRFDEFAALVDSMECEDVPALYTYAAAWAAWIQASGPSDYAALADVPRVAAIMERVTALDEGYEHGRAHLYLAVIETRAPALGGRPDKGRVHFERALELSRGRDLQVKVELARRYARLLFNRELHDSLLLQVLESDPVEPSLTLSNVLAQNEAQRLLDGSEEFFQ